MNKPFARLFETENGQILVKVDADQDGVPEVRFYASPPGLGVCSSAILFWESDSGWERAEEFFDTVDQEMAIKAAKVIFDMSRELTGEAA